MMGKKRLTKTMWYGADIDISGNPILPEIAPDGDDLAGLNEGEIYIHNHPGKPSIWIRTTDGKIVPVSGVDISVLEKMFLSKTKDDRSKGKIATDKAIEVGDFVSGASGAMIYKDETTGQTVGELDKLYVRMKAYFETLEIINVNSIGGKQIISPAGSVKCVGVEETETYYRCYFLAEQDGEKVQNRWKVGDQAYSQMFNAKEGVSNKVSNKYYWRLVVGVSDESVAYNNLQCHYVDLSVTDCDNESDVPSEGDVINQRGSRTDLDRMNFIEMSSVDSFSPNITLFHGVNSYSLDGKAYVSYGVDKSTNKAFMNVYGDMYVGDRQESSFMRYTQEGGLEIKGQLSVGTTLGGKDLQELINSATPEGYEDFVNKVTQDIEGLQNQIDGAIDSYFYQYEPSLTNYPAMDWDTEDEKKAHLNDTFTNLVDGRSWRWTVDNGVYGWTEITDTATTQALALAGQAQDTADGKRRVFVDTPKPPYDLGDLWSRGSDYPLMICVTPKDASGVYAESDFDYADNNAKLKEELQTLVSTTKDDLNNAIGQAKDEAVNNANAYTNEGKKALQANIDELEKSKANIDNVYTIAQADNKISEAETSAINAAKKQADAAIALSETTIKAYADGVVDDEEKARIKQAQENLDTAKAYAEQKAQEAFENALLSLSTFDYLKAALKEDTSIEGGLIQSSLIKLGYTSANTFKVMSGSNGIYNSSLNGGGIASWWGGDTYDLLDYYIWDGYKWNPKSNVTIPTNIPSGLIRFDGTGYFAKGKFWWDENGEIHADPTALLLSFDTEVGDETLAATIINIRKDIATFNDMWQIKKDSNGNEYLLSKRSLATNGGVTMYGTDEVDLPSILDSLPIASTSSAGIAYFDSTYFSVGSDGKVTLTSAPSIISTLGSLLNVEYSVDSTTSSDVVMYKAANSSMWTTKLLSEIGGSLNYPLRWTGYSNGTWDGSTSETIVIPVSLKNPNAITFTGAVSATYDGSTAVTVNIPVAGGDVDLSNYLPLSGGTINGILNIGGSDNTSWIPIQFNRGGTTGFIGSSINTIDIGLNTGYLRIGPDTLTYNFSSTKNYSLLHSGNYSSYALPLSGGTLTGKVIIKCDSDDKFVFNNTDGEKYSRIVFQESGSEYGAILFQKAGVMINAPGDFWYNGNTVWHSGNDGSGSGLDADLLDGLQPSALNVGSATKLQTARTIWGQSFDGTGNVSGPLYANTYIFMNSGSEGIYLTNNGINWHNSSNSFAKTILGFTSGGNVGIGTTSPTSKLSVYGDVFLTGNIIMNNGMQLYMKNSAGEEEQWMWPRFSDNNTYMNFGSGGYFFIRNHTSNRCLTISYDGNILAAGAITMYSDQRKKTILNNVELSLSQIANAPLVEHFYNSDDKRTTHVGSIAQYWANINDWFCKLDNEGYYTMEIQNCALASAISIARELSRYESKTDKTIKQLKKRICQLEEELERLKLS